MDSQPLRESLESLHRALSQTHELDEATQAALLQLQSDIRNLISDSESSKAKASSIDQRLRESILKFETRHPHLTSLLSQIGDGLANLGI